ncbi:hypothetical protein EV182_001535, partial [Spiromyces aspiralis]
MKFLKPKLSLDTSSMGSMRGQRWWKWLVGVFMYSVILSANLLVANAECGPKGHFVVGYYPSWKRAQLQDIPWDKLTHIQL